MILWYITGFCVLAVAFSVYWSIRRRYRRTGKEVAMVAEIGETAAISFMLIGLGFFMLIGKICGMEIGGTGDESIVFIGAFGAVLVIAGCEIMMRSFVRKVIAFHDRLVSHSYFGEDKVIYWKSVTEVKTQYLSRRASFKSEKESIGVNGKRSEYYKLIKTAKDKVPPIVASDTLARLLKRLEK